MRENVTYKAIRRLLQKTSLKRGKSDWEKMNDLLDQHLPVDPSAGGAGPGAAGSPFNFTIPVIVIGIAIISTTAFIFSRYGKSHKTGKSPQIATQTVTVIPADDSLQSILKDHRSFPNSLMGNRAIHSTSESKKMANNAHESDPEKSTAMNNPVVLKNGAGHVNNGIHINNTYARDKNSKKTNHPNPTPVFSNTGSSLTASSNTHSNNRQINSEGQKKSGSLSLTATETSGSGISALNKNRHHLYKSDLASLIVTLNPHPNFLTEEKFGEPHLNVSLLIKTSKGNITRNQRDSSVNKNNADKKKTAFPDISGSFKYGLTLPFLQMYNAAGVQSTRINFIPGITTEYMFNNHLGLGINILPYQIVNVNSNDSIFASLVTDTTNGRNKTTANTYYVSNLNTFNAGLHLKYQINRQLGFEVGFGYQHFYSGNGDIITRIKDSISSSAFSQNTHYSSGDSASANIGKSNFNYYLNMVYSMNKWEILLGYNLNSKSWITVPSAKSPGWFSLEVRYYFSTSGKK